MTMILRYAIMITIIMKAEDFVIMDDGDSADCNRCCNNTKTIHAACDKYSSKALLHSIRVFRCAFLYYRRLLT